MPSSHRLRPVGPNPVARRIAAYVNAEHQGNVRAAATALGCSYDQLWHAARGVRVKPNLALLLLLAERTGRSLAYWITGREA